MRTKIFSFILLLIVSGCVTSPENPATLKEGPLQAADQNLEQKLMEEDQQSHDYLVQQRKFFEDPALESYLNRVAEPFLQSLNTVPQRRFTFKVLRDPTLNAHAALAGFIYYHSGVFARIENEAQLAFILAHEISHVFHRDTLYTEKVEDRWVDQSKWLDTLFGSPMGLSNYGMVTDDYLELYYLVSMKGFGQIYEERADLFAVEQMVKLGYDPYQALASIDLMIDEKERYDPKYQKKEVFFYSDHPSNVARKEYLAKWIQEHQHLILQYNATRLEAERYRRGTYNIRRADVKLNLDHGRFPQAKDRALRLIKENPNDPTPYYYLGEAVRGLLKNFDGLLVQKPGEDWREMTPEEKEFNLRAFRTVTTASYRKAIQLNRKFPLPYRGLGMYLMEQGRSPGARRYFEKYLELEPQAKDRRSILYYLNEMAAGRQP